MKKRTHHAPQEKVAALKRHLVDKEPISKICDELGLNPTVFYAWQRQFFENGAAAFENGRRPATDPKEARIAKLEEKLQQKNEVLAELMEEHVKLKKELGEL
jgi:transposase-like protein